MTAGGYDPRHYAPILEVEDRHFWFRARNAVIEAMVRQLTVGWPSGYRVLEVGCGTGYVLQMLARACAGARVVGIDFLHDGLVAARKRRGVAVVQGRFEHPPFASSFDLLGLFDTLEHIEDDAGALGHLRRLLRTNGVMVITVPAYDALWSDFDVEAHHCRRYEPDRLRGRLEGAGFAVDYLTPFMLPLYPLARLGRLVADARRSKAARRGQTPISAVDEQLRLLPGNEVLYRLVRQEARLIARRRRLPFGTSLLAVARGR